MKVMVVILAVSAGLTGCAAIQRSQARDTEQLLAAAGFRMQLADTAQQQQQLAAMPAYRLVNHPKGDGVEYTYADPTNCKCAYVGGSKEYAEYQRLMTEQQIAQERLWAEENAMNWRPWGQWYWR
jgi:uncharacterized protein YceK